MIPNPFIYGDPVNPANFFNHRQAIRRVVGRLLSSSQSTALVGEPRTGKTSLLHYLAGPPEVRKAHYVEQVDHLLFAYLDTQTLGDNSPRLNSGNGRSLAWNGWWRLNRISLWLSSTTSAGRTDSGFSRSKFCSAS